MHAMHAYTSSVSILYQGKYQQHASKCDHSQQEKSPAGGYDDSACSKYLNLLELVVAPSNQPLTLQELGSLLLLLLVLLLPCGLPSVPAGPALLTLPLRLHLLPTKLYSWLVSTRLLQLLGKWVIWLHRRGRQVYVKGSNEVIVGLKLRLLRLGGQNPIVVPAAIPAEHVTASTLAGP